ncbi:MAG TPA: signal peptidase II [Frankiaceae bacterium]|jgi:signal peptidase II|nr:signal peptidase II [Frankiaceae bacterium]
MAPQSGSEPADSTVVPPVLTKSDPSDAAPQETVPTVPKVPRRRLPLLVIVAAVVLAADVVSKQLVVAHLSNRAPVNVIPSVLDLELTRNPGAAFGFAAGATIIFSVVAVAVVIFIARASRRLASAGWAWALGLLLGGALGNLGDRLFRDPGPLRGHVVDWIHLHHWPVFNLADSGIVIGGILAVLLSMRGIRLDGQHVHASPPGSGSSTE